MFGTHAAKLHANGWPWLIPIMAGQKRPALVKWQHFGPTPMTTPQIASMARSYTSAGIGLAYNNGAVMSVDLDVLDPTKAMDSAMLTMNILGETPLIRFGRAPKSLLVYRAAPGLQISGKGFGKFELYWKAGQTVFFGKHPDGFSYRWPDKSPLDVSPNDLPTVTTAMVAALIKDSRIPAWIDRSPCCQWRSLNHRGSGAAFASDRSSGHVAKVLPTLRAATDPLAKATEIVADAGEGDRYHTAMGVIIGLAMMGFSDREIASAVFGAYLAKFTPEEMVSRTPPIISGLRWARASTGPDRMAVDARFPANFGWRSPKC